MNPGYMSECWTDIWSDPHPGTLPGGQGGQGGVGGDDGGDDGDDGVHLVRSL